MVQFNQKHLATFCRANGIVRLRLFGSVARGDDTATSDVDLLVDFAEPVGYFELIRAEDGLSGFFGRSVDLLTEPAISPFMREAVLREATVIFDAGS
jgi:uncharacterized protein